MMIIIIVAVNIQKIITKCLQEKETNAQGRAKKSYFSKKAGKNKVKTTIQIGC